MKKLDSTLRMAIYLFMSIIGLFLTMKFFNFEKFASMRLVFVLFSFFFSNRLISRLEKENKPKEFLYQLRSLFMMNCIGVILAGVSLYLIILMFGINLYATLGAELDVTLTSFDVLFAMFMEAMYSIILVTLFVVIYHKEPIRKTQSVDFSDY